MKTQLRFLSQVITRCCLPVVALTALAGAAFAQVSVYLPASDPNITYLGRVRVRQGGDTPFGKEGAGIQWPGSGFKTWIYGTSKVSLLLSTEGQQYINDGVYAPIKFKAIVDGNETVFSQPDPNQLYGSWYWNYDITGLLPCMGSRWKDRTVRRRKPTMHPPRYRISVSNFTGTRSRRAEARSRTFPARISTTMATTRTISTTRTPPSPRTTSALMRAI